MWVKLNISDCYHHGLLNQSVAVFTHVLQDLVRSIVAGCGGRLGSHSQWVDQSLQKNTKETTNSSHGVWLKTCHVRVGSGFWTVSTFTWGWYRPMSVSSWWMRRPTRARGVSIRAMSWGITWTGKEKTNKWITQLFGFVCEKKIQQLTLTLQ